LRLIDRDFIETSNLQRQVLFDEHDVAENLPKAEAAARKLGAINSSVHVEPVVTDIDRTNILELVKDADLILDGSDNFEVRYLINDAAVKLGKPWVYGGCIGSHGQTMTILPGETPCLRCVFEAAPAPGEAGTCETAGVLGPIVNIIASFQATEALKILTGRRKTINRELIYVDVWENVYRRIKEARSWARWTVRAVSGSGSSGWTASTARTRRACAVATPCRCAPRCGELNFEDMAGHLQTLGR
jgi:adenylyltransferase/sulfurtransferase